MSEPHPAFAGSPCLTRGRGQAARGRAGHGSRHAGPGALAVSSSQGREAATNNQETMAAAHAVAEICRPSRAFHMLDLVVPGADAPGYESDAPSGLSRAPMSWSHRRGAAKRRKIFSLGREPQGWGTEKEKKPRSGDRHSTVNCRNSPLRASGWEFRIADGLRPSRSTVASAWLMASSFGLGLSSLRCRRRFPNSEFRTQSAAGESR